MTGIGNSRENQGGQMNSGTPLPGPDQFINHIQPWLPAGGRSANCGTPHHNLHCPGGRASFPAQELIEFAIVVPVLILVVFGALDLARGFFTAITITNAAREGARYGVSNPDDYTGMIAAARREASLSGIDLSGASIIPSCTDVADPPGCDSGTPVRVTVTANFRLLMGWVLSRSTITFSRYVEMLVP